MLPSSVRRVVATTTPQAAGLASSVASSTPRAVGSFFGHQRRNSSSKPSRSDNGSSELPTGQSVAAAAPARPGKNGGDKRKRKASANGNAAMKALPSVPNTHHMVGEGTYIPHPFFLGDIFVYLKMSVLTNISSWPVQLLLPPPTHLNHPNHAKERDQRAIRCHIRPPNQG